MVTLPMDPFDTVSIRVVLASQVETVQVGCMAAVVPPGTFERPCTGVTIVVVLVSGAELLSQMFAIYHRVAFKQQHVYKLSCV